MIHWDCPVFKYFGFYCPGCGGTRAVISLLHGDIAASFIYHPIVLYAVILAAAFAASFILQIITRGRIRMLRPRLLYIWIGCGIIVVNWIVKNIFLLTGSPLF